MTTTGRRLIWSPGNGPQPTATALDGAAPSSGQSEVRNQIQDIKSQNTLSHDIFSQSEVRNQIQAIKSQNALSHDIILVSRR